MEFLDIINELNNIIKWSFGADEILEKINASKLLSLENDINLICRTIKVEGDEVFYEFIEELINDGGLDLIKANFKNIGTRNMLKYTAESKNPELVDFVCQNFKELTDEEKIIYLQDIREILLDDEISVRIKPYMQLITEKMWPYNRLELIGIINNSQEKLGNIDDYVPAFLSAIDSEGFLGIERVLEELVKIEDLNKLKILTEVNNNFENLIKTFPYKEKYRVLDFLSSIKKIKDNFSEDSVQVQEIMEQIKNKISDNIKVILENQKYDVDLINLIKEIGISNSRIKEIQDDILNSLTGANLVKYIECAKANEGFDKEWNFTEFSRQLFKDNEQIMSDETVQVTIGRLIQELCEHEEIGIKDIKYAGAGNFSFNLKIGDYVLKLGKNVKKNHRLSIPYHKRILKPILRQQNNEEDKEEGVANVFIEIQNFVHAKWYEGLSQEEIKEQLYLVYKDLRDDGIIWTDVRPENVGKLLKPNKENFQIETLNENEQVERKEVKSDNYAIGFTGEEPKQILKAGELVIIDLDFIYTSKEEINFANDLYMKFEERYEREKKAKVENNIKTQGVKQIIIAEEYTREDLGTIAEEIGTLTRKDGKSKGE